MELLFIILFLLAAVFIFLLFDIWKARIVTGFYPFTRRTMAAYGPYTAVRAFIVAGVYWLGVFAPDLVGITIVSPALEPHWPVAMALIAPFGYLALFSGLGSLVLKSSGGLGGLGDWIDRVYDNIRMWGEDDVIKKLDSVPLDDIRSLFCGHLQEYVDNKVCQKELKELTTDDLAPPGSTSLLKKRSAVISYDRWAKTLTQKHDPSLWMNILRSVVEDASTLPSTRSAIHR